MQNHSVFLKKECCTIFRSKSNKQILIKTNFGLPAVTCPDIGHSAVDHGRWRLIYGMQNKYEAMMMLTCDPGYFYKGQRVIRCQANGTWDYPEPRPSCESECNIGYSKIKTYALSIFKL